MQLTKKKGKEEKKAETWTNTARHSKQKHTNW